MNDRDREPSMEEILSSIKRIIAEDNRKGVPKSARAPDEVLELTVEAQAPAPYPVADDDTDTAESSADADTEALDELLERETAQALGASLSALATLAEPGASPQIVRSGETSLEGLVREMLRPMLKDWLNAKLPGLVEEMVQREIRRITKKG